MLLGEQIAVMACVCCKCTSCKCGSAASKKKPNAPANAESSTLEIPHDPSDEDETYHIRGERHIPKKVYKPILKPPRSRRDSRQGRSGQKQQMVAIPQEGGLYAIVKSGALETEKVEKFVDLGKHQMEYIDANADEVMKSCRKGVTMKRGFRQFFSQERTVRNTDEDDANGTEVERKRPARFFQKFFRTGGSLSSSPAGSPRTFRRINNTDEDDYAEIKREMSVPVSPKSVKFEDEIPARRGQSAVPQTSAFTSRTATQQRTVSHQQKSHTSATSPFSWRSEVTNGELDTAESSQHSATSREVRGLRASQLALDEATRELLQLSALPVSAASISYSSTAKLTPAADQLQKSASTSSMNKVIRTVEGGVLKLSNVFTWDAARLGESSVPRSISPIERTFTNGDGNAQKTVLVYRDANRRGPPAVRTSIEGTLQMEKIVGADLANIEHCVSSGWTIKDTVTHYKVKTKMGERTLVMEERQLPNGEEPANDFKMSVYEGDALKSEQQAEIRIPPNMSKSEYLAHLSERLLRDMESLERDEDRRKTTTRIEIEVIEDVTKLLKTYIIGERAELQPQVEVELDQAAIDASDEFMSGEQTYEHASDDESSTPPIERVGKEYIDTLESERRKKIEPTDIHLLAEGQRFSGQTQLNRRAHAESEESSESVTAFQQEPRCASLSAECEMNRTEDTSCNDVTVAEPRVFSAQLKLIRGRTVGPERRAATYDMQQEGKHFAGETTIRRTNKPESEASVEESAETTLPRYIEGASYGMEQEGQRFKDQTTMRPVKKYESEDTEDTSRKKQITECELMRREDCSWNTVVIAVPRNEQASISVKRSRLIQRQAKAAAYDLEQEGQRFEGETVIKRMMHFESSASADEPLEELQLKESIKEPVPGNYEMQLLGQDFKGEGLIKRTRHFLSSESIEEEPGGGITQVELTKKSSQGQFEATIVISNDYKALPIRLRECSESKTIGLVASFAHREPDSFRQQTVLADRNRWTESYNGRELNEEQLNVMVAIQKARRNEEMRNDTEKNLFSTVCEGVVAKIRECIEEQAVAVCSLKCAAIPHAGAEFVYPEKRIQTVLHCTSAAEEEFVNTKALIASSEVSAEEAFVQQPTANCATIKHSCVEATSTVTSAMVCLQNSSATNSMLSAEQVCRDRRFSKGHMFGAIATSDETLNKEFSIRRSSQYSRNEQADLRIREKLIETIHFCTKSIREETSTTRMELSKAAKLETGSIKLLSKERQKHRATVAEFGDEMENFAILLQNSGAAHGHAVGQWAEPVTGRLSSSRSRIECFSDDAMLDLLTATATKQMHLFNYKTLLPLHGAAQIILPIANSSSASLEDEDVRDGSVTVDHDEKVIPRRIHVRVSEDTQMNSNENVDGAGQNRPMNGATHHTYSENLAEICYLIKVTRNEESANCNVVITVACKCWTSFPMQRSARISAGHRRLEMESAASSSLTDTVSRTQQMPCRYGEAVKPIAFAKTDEHTSKQVTIIRVVPIVLGENRELQTQRTAFKDDQETHHRSTFQFRSVPITHSKVEVTDVNKVTSASLDKTALGTLADSFGIGIANDFYGSRPKIASCHEYQAEYGSEDKRESDVRDGIEGGIWHGDTERSGTQISTSTMSENTSSAGSTTSASFEQFDTSRDDRSRFVAVSDLPNTCRQDDDTSTYEQISRSSTIHAARSTSLEYHLRQSSKLESTEERHPVRDHVFYVPIGREIAVVRTRSRSRTDSDKTLTEEQNPNETLGVRKRSCSHSRAGWITELSAARIAMMQAGVDLETVLLSTPASRFVESSMRRELYDARQYLNTHRSVSESDFTSGDLNWDGTGFYRSFEYHHHWSSERDIRTVAIEENRPRSLRSSSAERLERLIRTSDSMEDNMYVQHPQLSGVYQTDVTNFIHQQHDRGKLHRHLIVAKEEQSDRKGWSNECIIQRDRGERSLSAMKSEQHSFERTTERPIEVNQRMKSSGLRNLLYEVEPKMPPIPSYSNAASQTESAFKEFGYITTIDTVLHSDEKADEVSERSYTDETRTYERMSTESMLQTTSASIKKDTSTTAVTFIPPKRVNASTSEGVHFHTSVSSRTETGDKATQTVMPLEFTERSGIGGKEQQVVSIERIRPVLLSTRFAQTEDIRESVVQRPFQDIYSTHNIIQNSTTEQISRNARQQSEEFSHTDTVFDTITRTTATSLRDTKLTTELISAKGSVLETIDSSQYVKRKEEFADVDKLQAVKRTSHESRKFAIEEQHSESIAKKMSADAAAYDIVVQTAAQDTARREFVEYGDRRSSTSASFQRMERGTEKEFTSTNVADAVTLRASLDASASSSEHVVGQLEIDRPREDRNVLRTLREGNVAVETRSVDATTESSATIEKAFDARAEFIATGVTLEGKEHIQASTTHKELGDETQMLDANWSTVVREANAQKYLPMTMTGRRSLETSASEEQTTTCEAVSEKIEERFLAEQVQPLCEEFSMERNWKVSAQKVENLMKKFPDDEFTEKSVSEKQHVEIRRRFLEQGEAECTTGGAFTRVERTQQAATIEGRVALQRKLAMSFETMPVQEETTIEQLQLEKEGLLQFETEAKINEKNADIIFSSMHAAIESDVTETVSFSGGLERTSAQESVFPERKVKEASITTAESRTEEQNYIGGWNTVVREMSTESNLIDVLELTGTLTTSASEESTVQILSEVQKQPHTDFAVEVHPMREKCIESRGFEINNENQKASFERTEASAACEYVAGDRWHQRGEVTVNEFGSADAEAVGFFSRIALRRHDSEKVEVVKRLARVWHEFFDALGSKEEECINDIHLTLADKAAFGSLLVKDANRADARLSTEASKVEVVAYGTELESHTAEWPVTFTMSSKNRESAVSTLFEPVSIAGKFLDAAYVTVLNDEEIEVSVDDTFKAHAVLSTEASKLNQVQTAGLLEMKSLEQSAVFSVPITQFSARENRFGISEERYEKLVERAQAKSEAENVFKDIVRGGSVSRLLIESGEAEANTGVLLMRRAACRKSAHASHVIDVSATLTQHLDTQGAKEAFNDISLYFSLPTSETEVQDTITLSNAENIVLKTEYAKEEITTRSVGFTRAKDERREAESVLKASTREHAKKQMKESASDAFEILSELTTVYRDLEAEAALRHALNVKRVVTVLATTEENTQLNEEWSAHEAVMEAEHSLPELAFNTCEGCFAIESDWLRITLEKFAQSDGALKLRKDAKREVLSAKMRESGQEKLNAIINLCKVSNVRLLRNASEYIWADRLTISAEPIRLTCEAAEIDTATIDKCLQRLPSQYSVQCVRISAVTTQPISFECEQAGDEKTKMLIDIRGKQITYDAAGKVWPLSNRGERVDLETEEYVEDKCALFAQLNSRQVTFADCGLYLAICRNHEPIELSAKASHEEVVTFTDHWQIAPQLQQLTHTRLIGNRGEHVTAKVNETQEHLRTIGVQYSQEEHSLSAECRNVEARFGGEYVLVTKASQEECRNTSLGLSRRSQVEMLRARLTQNLRSLSSLCVHASTSENTSLELAYSRIPSFEEIAAQKTCQRMIEPISAHFTESAEITHVIHAHFKTRESHFLLPIVVKLANFGGHFSLHTDNAEESIFNGEYFLRKDEYFTTTSGVLQGSNKAADVILRTACAKESSTICTESWSKDNKYEETTVIRKQAITGQPCAVKMKESVDIKQSTYLQYSKEPQELSIEKTVDEALFGGRFHIDTDASEEHEQNVCREVKADRRFVMHTDKLLVEHVTMKKQLTLKATSLISAELTRDLTREMAERAVAAVLQDKNRDRCRYSVREAEEEELTANAYYSKDSQQLISGRVVQLARDGGSFMLFAKATTYEEHILDMLLEKDRLHESFTSYTVIIVNSELPTLLETKQSEVEISNVSEHLQRSEQKVDTSTLRRATNRGEPVSRRMKEMSECEEITHCQYKRAAFSVNVEHKMWEKRYGGSHLLHTMASTDYSLTATANLCSRRSSVDGTQIIVTIANRLKEATFSAMSTAEESIALSCSFNKQPSFTTAAQIRKTPNIEAIRCSVVESMQVDEIINIQLENVEEKQSKVEVMADKRFGGSIVLSTDFAQESEIGMMESLIASPSEMTAFASITLSLVNTTVHPILSTAYSSELAASCSFQLTKASQMHRADIKRLTPNKGECIVVSMNECTSVQSNTQLNYTKNAHVAHISEVIAESRYGGSIRLDTFASEDSDLEHDMAMMASRTAVISVGICIVEKNAASPVYLHASAAGDETASAIAQLQKSSVYCGASQTLVTSRRGEGQQFRLKESIETDEYISVQMRREEFGEDVETTLSEGRFGGRILLGTSHAEECSTSAIEKLAKEQVTAEVSAIMRAVNRAQPIIESCRAIEETEVEVICRLECSKDKMAEVLVLRSASNAASPVCLQTGETVESLLTINVSMQKPRDEEIASYIGSEKRYGGGGCLACAAASEQSTEEIVLRFQKSSALARSSLVVCTANKTMDLLQTNASTETTIVVPVSMSSRCEQMASASVHCALALFGGCVSAKFMASEETIFNADVSYEKQHSEAQFTLSRQVIREESPKALTTAASQTQQIEVTGMEMRRRLTEVHVESAIERAAREITPVSLQTDYASETLIRTDEELSSLQHRHVAEVCSEQSVAVMESDRIVCTTPVQVELRHEEESHEGLKEEKSEKRVSFAAEVTEKTLSMDMSMTIERREAPSIIKKPMKRESRGRRSAFKQNEAPNFVPMRRNSLLMALAMGSPHNIPHFRTLEDVIKGIKRAGLEYSNLIFGIDYTRSNYYQGEKTFDGRNLHDLSPEEMNPYQQVIEIVGKTLSSFDADGVIPAYGFGDEETTDQSIFNLYDKDDLDAECNGFEEVLRIYNEKTPFINMSGPTNFVPLIEKAVQIVRTKQSYHILVIVADGQVTNEKINQKAIAAASHYPLSIIMVGVGDGPWSMMTRFDETLPKRMFDNFHFVDFHKVMYNAPNQEASFALNALMEIPDQYKAIKELGLLKHSRRG